ncbi:helix-turn-helix transcriptional regulator [Lacinutrix sp. 5H-3-7-4]|uniref:helix-turn-helix domain-containing protein n=1 Tax=Lacinutrix sp. (strain 5H-3-7-4) TaxID=983544 RepID=UPI00020A3603|nr:helix-turn-helix transcriptional regulator [Lacinutrix sp. 5H-3-7-4]AEH02246.1 helix-turn-helix domain protein [Lacinutrix sp. 5H-3-7-4]
MINNQEFTKRLKKVIDYYGESASSFAEKIGVQRSSISHILSGRNKPSLEFVLKVLSTFPEVELYWLMNGKGNFPSVENNKPKIEKKPIAENQDLFSKSENENLPKEISVEKIISSNSKKEIERIIIFYKDGSFSNFEN